VSTPSRPLVQASRLRIAAGFVSAFAGVTCGTAPVHHAPTVAPTPPAVTQHKPPVVSPKPLSEAERRLLPELRKDVDQLVIGIGQRDVDHPWELADAADYLATELEAAGYPIERHGFEVRGGKAVVQNLSVRVSGERGADESILVAAHYDTPPASRGADDNASGAALLLALARSLRDAHPDRALRFAFLVNEHEPFAGTGDMGSLRFARQLAAAGDKVTATIALRAVGGTLFGRDGASSLGSNRSKSVPEAVFVSASPSWAHPLAARVARLLAKDFNVTMAARPATEHPIEEDLGVWGFWQAGFPAVLLTRDPGGEASRSVTGDEPPLDYATMARLALSLRSILLELATVDDSGRDDRWLAPVDS
jgi:hypothetical protein